MDNSTNLPQLSTPGQLDIDQVLKKYEVKVGQLTTQNVMLESQLEAALTDRQSLVGHIETLQAQLTELQPTPEPEMPEPPAPPLPKSSEE